MTGISKSCVAGFCLLLLMLTVGCTSKPLLPAERANPWMDDYTSVSAMGNYAQWGTYNVHDPSCLLVGDTFYMYSTDAIYAEDSTAIKDGNLPFGYVQVRKSKDLVNWEFAGWVFDKVPSEAMQWVHQQSGGIGANNVWAPYIVEYQGKYRLYYCVSAFAKQTSYIGLAESDSPEGPWIQKGCVVRTTTGDVMNAIDPSIVTNPVNGEQWMHYGSYFGGLHCLQLDPVTGLALRNGDQGHLIARRFDGRKNNIEAPEIIYNPALKQYFLFVSYDPLMTTYNVRVGRSDKPEGPFVDFFGNDLSLEEDNLPILTYPYQFSNHVGWAGTGHCCVFMDAKGNYFMAHQSRLRPDNHLMALHVRQIFWTPDGWPVVSPERYAGDVSDKIEDSDLFGRWEFMVIKDNVPSRGLEAGQVLWGENKLKKDEEFTSSFFTVDQTAAVDGDIKGLCQLKDGNRLIIRLGDGSSLYLDVFVGQDWENQTKTILLAGLTDKGYSFWGKKIN
jgi:arabinan endo-1,5-alpha-L-arabinosidase